MAALGAGALERGCVMIDKREILETASALGLLPNVVEKGYVLGWLLAGINAHPDLTASWVFKGGTCLKKCYFETYRFSEDLDFTLRDESQLEEGFLRRVLGEVIAWVADESGLVMPAEQLSFDIYVNPRQRPSCPCKVGYRGPVSPASNAGGWPKIKLDLRADEKPVLPSVRREVFHPCTDRPEQGMWINSYAYEEAFGEKVRALGERTRPRDLYDVVNLYRHGRSTKLASLKPSSRLIRRTPRAGIHESVRTQRDGTPSCVRGSGGRSLYRPHFSERAVAGVRPSAPLSPPPGSPASALPSRAQVACGPRPRGARPADFRQACTWPHSPAGGR